MVETNYKKIKFPAEPIKKSIAALSECKKVFDAQDEIINAFPSNDVVLKTQGESGLAEKNETIRVCEAKKKAASKVAKKAIEEQYKKYIDYINEQITPSGEDLKDNADYTLLRDGLIMSAEELSLVANKNPENIAFLNAVQKYASEKEWDGFGYLCRDKALREYGDNFFEGALIGAESPNGYQGMRTLFEGEPKRMAQEHGIIEEFNSAMGK